MMSVEFPGIIFRKVGMRMVSRRLILAVKYQNTPIQMRYPMGYMPILPSMPSCNAVPYR